VWPRSVSTHLFAARLERLAQNYPLAADYLERAQELQQGPSDASQLEWLCLRAEAGDVKELELGMRTAIAAGDPGATLMLEALARTSFRRHHLGMVLYYVNLWLDRDPRSVRAWVLAAATYDLRSSPAAAVFAYKKVLELQPQRWRARLQLATMYLLQHQSEEAGTLLQQLKEEHGAEHDVELALARWYRLMSRDEDAKEVLHRLLLQAPVEPAALLLLGQLECEDGNPARGETFLKQALAFCPKDTDMLWWYYRCLQQQGGRLQEAREIYDRYVTLNNATHRLHELLETDVNMRLTDPAVLTEIGQLFESIGYEEQAIEFYYRALRADRRFLRAHKALQTHFTRIGDSERAAEHEREVAGLER
jgi:tetratricopeptide (TPR) repeat protein